MASKNYCSIHHLYYSGNECPMCRDERTAIYVKKYGEANVSTVKEEKNKKENKSREINEEDISKLMEKFNCK